MLISISRRKKKAKSPDAMNRSVFLKMLFGHISGDFGNSLMSQFNSGNYTKFAETWKTLSDKVIEDSIEKAKELKKYDEAETKPAQPIAPGLGTTPVPIPATPTQGQTKAQQPAVIQKTAAPNIVPAPATGTPKPATGNPITLK